jgi:hypothetical protein
MKIFKLFDEYSFVDINLITDIINWFG